MSDREVAEHVGVHCDTVGQWRRNLEALAESDSGTDPAPVSKECPAKAFERQRQHGEHGEEPGEAEATSDGIASETLAGFCS